MTSCSVASHTTPSPSTVLQPGKAHIAFVDSLRGFAAFYVVLHHAVMYFWPPWNPAPNSLAAQIFVEAFAYGRFAVTIFIVLSGYCLALPVLHHGWQLRNGFRSYLQRRARRILPPYYAAFVLSLLALWLTGLGKTETLWDHNAALSGAGVLSHALMCQDFTGQWHLGQVNYVFWSVAVEWHIYFLMPLILWGWRNSSPALVTIGMLMLFCGLSYSLRNTALTHLCFQYYGLFALGMFAAKVGQSETKHPASSRRLCLALLTLSTLLTVALVVHFKWMRLSRSWTFMDLLVGIACASLLVLLSQRNLDTVRRLLEWRPFVFVGTFSYSIYLVHALTLHASWLVVMRFAHLSYLSSMGVTMLLSSALTLLGAYLFHLGCEKPFMNAPTPAVKGSRLSSS